MREERKKIGGERGKECKKKETKRMRERKKVSKRTDRKKKKRERECMYFRANHFNVSAIRVVAIEG